MSPTDMEVRPDEKGPKNLAVILLLSSIIVAGMGWQDWQLHNDGLTDEQIETFLQRGGQIQHVAIGVTGSPYGVAKVQWHKERAAKP